MKEQGLGRKDSNPARSLGFKHRSAEGAGDTTGRARFEDSASEEGTTGRTRARTSCPVQEPTGVSLDSGYSTDLSVPASAEEQKNYRTGEAKEYNRPRNRSRAPQGGRQCRRHRSEEREDFATSARTQRGEPGSGLQY